MTNAPILLLHGAGGGAWEWAVWQRVLAAHGHSAEALELVPAAAGLAATTLDDYAREAERAARALVGAPILVGASLGGLLAAMLASKVDARALVLINPLPPAPLHTLLPQAAASPPIIPWGRLASLDSTRRALPDADDASCEWAWRRWRDESGAVVDAARAGVNADRPRCPILVLASGLDAEVPEAASTALAAQWSASLIRLPGCSHVGPLLGRAAARCALLTAAWLGATLG